METGKKINTFFNFLPANIKNVLKRLKKIERERERLLKFAECPQYKD